MIFTSVSFFVFFALVFILYYFPLKVKTNLQNWLLLFSSYFFYGYASWKLLPLLVIATLGFFVLGIAIKNANNYSKSFWLTTLGILMGVGILFYFKYFNFFIDSFESLLNTIGLKSNVGTFNIIMPLGISYFTFKLISYVIEVHRGNIEPSKDIVAFSTFIAFFPTILAGPIDRPNSFIPQLQKKRSFNYSLAVDGCRQVLWGMFQKIVIADNLAVTVNHVWSDIPNQSGGSLFIVAILYSIQIYTDFSGYSHIAIGVGKVLGFRITKNFNYPYFSKNIAEFWRNWHMSLTSWLTDYVFMPLNIKFRDLGKLGIMLAIIINMVAVGLWHGANWTFVVFGLYNGLLFMPLILRGSFFERTKVKSNNILPSMNQLSKMGVTFLFVTLGLVVFRAASIAKAWEYLSGIFIFSSNSFFDLSNSHLTLIVPSLVFSILFFIVEWFGREGQFGISRMCLKWKRPLRMALYSAIIISIYWFGGKEQEYIYFQF